MSSVFERYSNGAVLSVRYIHIYIQFELYKDVLNKLVQLNNCYSLRKEPVFAFDKCKTTITITMYSLLAKKYIVTLKITQMELTS